MCFLEMASFLLLASNADGRCEVQPSSYGLEVTSARSESHTIWMMKPGTVITPWAAGPLHTASPGLFVMGENNSISLSHCGWVFVAE